MDAARRTDRPVLAVVDVSDAGRADPGYHAALEDLSERIVQAGLDAGFAPRRLPAEQLSVPGLLDAVQGAAVVVLTGGEDVDPAQYGGIEDYPGRGQHFTVADAAQIALVRRLVADRVPTIGICRGMQLVNVALGGDLVQHIADGGHVGAGDVAASMTDHAITVEPGSALAAAVGTTVLTGRCAHHQAVGRPGTGLRVVATADDGTPEAVEHVGAPLVAVQWHPEDRGAVGSVLRDLLVAVGARADA